MGRWCVQMGCSCTALLKCLCLTAFCLFVFLAFKAAFSKYLFPCMKMSLVDLGKRLLEAARKGEDDEVRKLMASGAPFTTDWVRRGNRRWFSVRNGLPVHSLGLNLKDTNGNWSSKTRVWIDRKCLSGFLWQSRFQIKHFKTQGFPQAKVS